MVARLGAAVEPHERPDRGSVRKAHYIGRDEAQHVHIPARAAVEVGGLKHEVPVLCHLRRGQRRTLRIVDANRVVRGIVRNGRANRLRRDRGEAVSSRFSVSSLSPGSCMNSHRTRSPTAGSSTRGRRGSQVKVICLTL